MSTRILAAFVGLAVVLPLLFFGGQAGTGFVVAVALVLCLGEYAQMAFPEDFRYAFYWLCLAAVPLAIAIFPQEISIPTSALEPEFQNLKDAKGKLIEHVVCNKGL